MRETVYGNWHRHAAILPSAYVSMIEMAGGIPMIIPPAIDTTKLLDMIDGYYDEAKFIHLKNEMAKVVELLSLIHI